MFADVEVVHVFDDFHVELQGVFSHTGRCIFSASELKHEPVNLHCMFQDDWESLVEVVDGLTRVKQSETVINTALDDEGVNWEGVLISEQF